MIFYLKIAKILNKIKKRKQEKEALIRVSGTDYELKISQGFTYANLAI